MHVLGDSEGERHMLFALGTTLAILAYFITFAELGGMSAYVAPAIIWLLAAVLLVKSNCY